MSGPTCSRISSMGSGNRNMEAPNMTSRGEDALMTSTVRSTSMFMISGSKNMSTFFSPLIPAGPHLVWLMWAPLGIPRLTRMSPGLARAL